MSIKRNIKRTSDKKNTYPRSKWLGIGIVATLTLMLCLTINYRAFSIFSLESAENEMLEQKIQSVTTNNLSLQEQIHYLKNDPDTVAREARKFGLRRPNNEKVSVPVNK
jgi:hypothetical protein